MRTNKLAGACVLLASMIACTIPDKSFQAANDADPPDAPPAKYTLTVTRSGTGTGTIASAPGAINCGTACSDQFEDGTSVTLTATPASNSIFVGWTGDCSGTAPCMVDMTEDATVGAEFALMGSPTIVGVSSSTANGSYNAGKVISVSVMFSENIVVTGGPPTLALNTGGSALNSGGSGTNTLTFTYTVAAGENAADLDCANSTALSLGGGTLKSSVGIDASLVLPALGATGSLGANKALVIDTVAPTVSMVNSTTGAGAYTVGGAISIQVHFAEAVTVTGAPTLALSSGGSASYGSGSGTTSLTFGYTVAAGQSSADLDYASTTALALPGGATVRDTAGNNATLTLPGVGSANSLAGNEAIVVDTAGPQVTNVTSSTVNGSYDTGAMISIQIAFNEAVTVTGTPTLALNNGGTASYSSGTGTGTLTFLYPVAAGEDTADLDYTSTTALSGTLKDSLGNNAPRTLPTPGAAGSLGANKDLAIDTCNGTQMISYFADTVVTFTAPSCATTVTIEAWGAEGGTGGAIVSGASVLSTPGKGARMKGTFSAAPFSILVGSKGGDRTSYTGGGGGGSFVWVTSTSTLLIAAGGGGGGGGVTGTVGAAQNGMDAVTTMNGTHGTTLSAGAGTNGNGGVGVGATAYGGGGAGWLSAGANGVRPGSSTCSAATGGKQPSAGGAGGLPSGMAGAGGFGGGGGGLDGCNPAGGGGGGGGGYSGGGGGAAFSSPGFTGGGGGGSYNTGTNASNTAGARTGNGQVIITW